MREKLIELFCNAQQVIHVPYGIGTKEAERYIFQQMADHLIANGVVIQPDCQACAKATNEVIANLQKRIATDNNVGDKKQRFLLRENGDIVPLTNCQQWIPVTERLPEDGVLVLCIGSKGGMFLGRSPSLFSDGTAYFCVPNARSCRYATYWMPLPEPPKGE